MHTTLVHPQVDDSVLLLLLSVENQLDEVVYAVY